VKALIKVGYACNQLCGFCHRLELRGLDGSREQVHERIERARELGHSMVVLSGGEPTIRPELMEWAAHVAELEMDLGLITNGQMLAYPDLVSRLCAHRLRYVQLSLHGGTAEVHDRVVRAAAFERARSALEHLRDRDIDVVINTVVTTENLAQLRPIVDLALAYPELTCKLSMVEARGGAASEFDELVPPVAEVAARVREAIAYGERRRGGGAGPRFAHDGIPFCLLPGMEGCYEDLRTSGFASMIEVDENDFFPVDERGRIQPDKCSECALRGPCPGLYRIYFERRGDSEIAPVTERAGSNSFHYVFERTVAEPDAARCPLLEIGVQPWDRGRTLFLRDHRGVSLYRTRTRDFSDRELERIKHGLGQIYFDSSDKAALDCFSTDLVKLERSSWCGSCPERPHCTGMFERSESNSFARDDAVVQRLVGQVDGDVLDVGCGDGRYGDILAAGAASGRLRYVGIDPEERRLERLAARWPWAEVHAVAAEDAAALGSDRFDWVLILRSWNHLRDPDAALAALVPLLRAGGRLVIVDGVAFGVARSRTQAERSETSAAGFEHLRNHSAAEADQVVSRFGLARVERRDVSAASSCEWLLVYRAP